jgi:hypothetical protein
MYQRGGVMQQIGGCQDDNCAKVFQKGGDAVIQGNTLDAETLAQLGQLPAGEQAIRIPLTVLAEAAQALGVTAV